MNEHRRATLFMQVERLTELPMFILSVLFLIIVVLPDVVSLTTEVRALLDQLLWLIWGVFALELFVKTYLAPQRLRYLMTHWPDVLVVMVPFLRPLRLLRVAITAARVWNKARKILHHRTLSFIGVTSLITVVLCAALVYAAERHADGPIQRLPDALWWAVATITTVGYGDVYPKTGVGRGVAVFLMLTGITLFGLLTAKVAAFFVEEDSAPHSEQKLDEIVERLARIEERLSEYERYGQRR